MNKSIKKLILLSIFGALVFGGWQANLKWEEFKPVLAELEEKDPEKYAKMVEETQSFHISETKKLYRELDRMTFAEVIDLRYSKHLEKRKTDKKYREDSYDEELQTREKERKNKLENDQTKIEELKSLHLKKPVKVRFGQWGKIQPWQQRLILREKCIKYFKRQIEDNQTQNNGLKTSKANTLVSRVGQEPLEIENLCEGLVPMTSDPQVIQSSILRLKESMNFYYFSQLLDETGIPRAVVFRFKGKLEGMSRDYNDS
ncbi:MAG: hypothetical protein ACI8PD_001153 [Nitrospinales bacterium]|jgi:hypothetical protein